jgi:hypothetical protein
LIKVPEFHRRDLVFSVAAIALLSLLLATVFMQT